jgi:acylphosphatase
MEYAAFLARVSGVVQGVGFRYFTYREATALDLTGYVKNLVDGSVEVFSEGPKSSLQEFLKIIRIGPRFGYVKDIKIEWLPYEKKYEKFSISHDYGY